MSQDRHPYYNNYSSGGYYSSRGGGRDDRYYNSSDHPSSYRHHHQHDRSGSNYYSSSSSHYQSSPSSDSRDHYSQQQQYNNYNRPPSYTSPSSSSRISTPPSASSPSSSSTPSNISPFRQSSSAHDYDDTASPPRSPSQSSASSGGSKIREMSYEERVSTFKKMLDDCKVQTDDDWSRAMKRVGNDPRVKLIKRVQDRQDIFYKYISEKKEKEREANRERRRKLKEDFMNMLSELKSTIFANPKSYLSTTYQQVLPKIENDHRFLNVEHEDDRLDYFYSFLDELERKDKDSIKQERKKNMANFHDLLCKKQEQGLINYRSLWRQIKDKIQNEGEYKALDYCDRLMVWESFISNLELEHYNKKKQKREEKQRLLKEQADKFWQFLIELKQKRMLNVLSAWKEVKPLLEDDERYQSIASQMVELPPYSPRHHGGDSNSPRLIEKPRKLFDDYIEHLVDLYKNDKKTFRKIIKDLNVEIDENSTFENFKTIIEKDERTKSIDPDNLSILFEEAVDKAKKKRKRSTMDDGDYPPLVGTDFTTHEFQPPPPPPPPLEDNYEKSPKHLKTD
ncbi:hypothetical protein C9374_012290 [Naegleria lovaniensis]|uniref:FF domain-containing protein n=1 Tax=Naegleria lovaniensis TaxID=51637 RepID=A0AA88GB87_NAELO|nr:uncharacterized protein C9374_012290 [Naegleria lovaniensis]KAG2373301.1 hypothetical protein C9374_012290 [Naegleria lovaniensis]